MRTRHGMNDAITCSSCPSILQPGPLTGSSSSHMLFRTLRRLLDPARNHLHLMQDPAERALSAYRMHTRRGTSDSCERRKAGKVYTIFASSKSCMPTFREAASQPIGNGGRPCLFDRQVWMHIYIEFKMYVPLPRELACIPGINSRHRMHALHACCHPTSDTSADTSWQS